MSYMTTVEYLACWFVWDMWEVRIEGFDPPEDFVDACVEVMVNRPGFGWPADQRDAARAELTSYWPDYRGGGGAS